MTAASSSDFIALIKAPPSEALLAMLGDGFSVDSAMLPALREIARVVTNRVFRGLRVRFAEIRLEVEAELVTRVNDGRWRSEFVQKVEEEKHAKPFWYFLHDKLLAVFKSQKERLARRTELEQRRVCDMPVPLSESMSMEDKLAVQRELRALDACDASIVQGIYEGHTTHELAAQLGVTERTVRNRLAKICSRVYAALGVVAIILFVLGGTPRFWSGTRDVSGEITNRIAANKLLSNAELRPCRWKLELTTENTVRFWAWRDYYAIRRMGLHLSDRSGGTEGLRSLVVNSGGLGTRDGMALLEPLGRLRSEGARFGHFVSLIEPVPMGGVILRGSSLETAAHRSITTQNASVDLCDYEHWR